MRKGRLRLATACGLFVLALALSSCGGIAEIQFVEAHGCGGSTAAVVLEDGSRQALSAEFCGYALETPTGVVGCAVIESATLNGFPLGAGAVPPSHEACYSDGAFSPFRLGADRAVAPGNARRLDGSEKDVDGSDEGDSSATVGATVSPEDDPGGLSPNPDQ